MGDYSKRLKEILVREGCFFERQCKGSHEMWYSPRSDQSFVVVSKIKKRHTANEILKQAGLDKVF